MPRSTIERRLTEVSTRLKQLREDLRVADEQALHFADEASSLETRAIVTDSGHAAREYRDAQRHADSMARHRIELAAEIAKLEKKQDDLLDEMLDQQGNA